MCATSEVKISWHCGDNSFSKLKWELWVHKISKAPMAKSTHKNKKSENMLKSRQNCNCAQQDNTVTEIHYGAPFWSRLILPGRMQLCPNNPLVLSVLADYTKISKNRNNKKHAERESAAIVFRICPVVGV